MEKSKVFFTNFRTTPEKNILQKLRNLIEKAGMPTMDLDGKFTAVKIHFGEPGNMAFLRPNYVRVVVDMLKEMGARPFLTDCNTLYVGMRRNALDHLQAAFENGFGPMQAGCHVIIADGLTGNDDVHVPIDGIYCKEAIIGRAAVDAEAIISVNHFKGHEGAGFGGALKNIGMGLGSTAGKRHMHHDGKPAVRPNACVGCGLCMRQCAHGAISFVGEGKERKAVINHDICVGCGRCVGACRHQGAITGPDSSCEMLGCKISEYAMAVLKDKPHFHVSLVMDVSPFCDCHSENDAPIIPDVGIFASFDPVALDMACADACNKMHRLEGTYLTDQGHNTGDIFNDTHPVTNWRAGIEHAQKLGLGTMDYELIEV
ncbi:MAG: DUF362 domain-containing protein [Clostridiales bacterium]|nr:DUF362 domain-containing protein [Clostridiales bacterium]